MFCCLLGKFLMVCKLIKDVVLDAYVNMLVRCMNHRVLQYQIMQLHLILFLCVDLSFERKLSLHACELGIQY